MAPAAPPTPRTPPPGEGILCAEVIYSLLNEVGSRCFPEEDPERHAAIRESLAKLDEFILKNSTRTQADLEKFKREQAAVGAPKERLCQSEQAVGLYRHMIQSVDAAKIRSATAQAVSRPGTPTFGDCL